MGLDIYLEDRAYKQRSDAREKASEQHWKEWGDKPDSPEKAAANEKVPPFEMPAEVPSTKYPEHLCNRRYLRSSYNSSGFNRAVPDMIGLPHDFYWIFEPVIGNDPPYETKLDREQMVPLAQVRGRALEVAQEIRDCDPLRTETATGMVSPTVEHLWSVPPTAEQVLDWYREEKAKREEQIAKAKAEGAAEKDWRLRNYGYSNAKGQILGFETGLEVLAITSGRDVLGQPAAVFVYRLSDKTKQHYVATAEIVAEFAEEAIALIKRDGECYLSWSG
jgi:hypothetical protein